MPSLRALAGVADVRLVVTQPDRPASRGQRLQPTPVSTAARELGLAVITPERLRPVLAHLQSETADLFAVASYGKIVPQGVLDLPPLGALNVHPSLLPLYRGATPLQAVLRDGRNESGVSIILMDAGMDTGNVVLQERYAVGERETFGELHDRFAGVGARMLADAVRDAASGRLTRTPQAALGVSEAEIAATLTRPLAAADLEIDWHDAAKRVVDLIRSLAPKPGARGRLAGGERALKILSARVAADETPRRARTPGSVNVAGLEPTVECGDGRIVLERVIPPDRRPMNGREFAAMLRQSLARA